LHRLGQVVRVLVLVDLDRRAAGGQPVGRDLPDGGLDVPEWVHGHPSKRVSRLCACPRKPSASAMRVMPSVTRARPARVRRTRLWRRWKSRTDSGDAWRAAPPVGSTWLGPMPETAAP